MIDKRRRDDTQTKVSKGIYKKNTYTQTKVFFLFGIRIKKNLLVYILNNLICLVNAEYLLSVVTCVRASLLAMASEIEGREAHHLFNLSFCIF